MNKKNYLLMKQRNFYVVKQLDKKFKFIKNTLVRSQMKQKEARNHLPQYTLQVQKKMLHYHWYEEVLLKLFFIVKVSHALVSMKI